jgi:hypothetical protein
MPIPLLTPGVTPPSQQVAILSLSKRFLSTPLLQRAIALVHSGQILFASSATNSTTQQRAILPDLYASRTVRDRAGRSVWRFDARRARETGGRLGTDRLRVPKWREVIELVKCVPLARDYTPSRFLVYSSLIRLTSTDGCTASPSSSAPSYCVSPALERWFLPDLTPIRPEFHRRAEQAARPDGLVRDRLHRHRARLRARRGASRHLPSRHP